MVSALHRMLLRDLWHLRGQAVAAALVVACGVASFVAMRSTHESLVLSQTTYYEAYRFADVFAQLKRARLAETTSARVLTAAQFKVRSATAEVNLARRVNSVGNTRRQRQS